MVLKYVIGGVGNLGNGENKLKIISNLVEKENGFIPDKVLFSGGSLKQGASLWLKGSLPGQKIMRLAKKGGGSSFPRAGFRRFSPAIPLPPRLFAETKKGDSLSFRPALFVFGACFFARAARERSERPTAWEMIQKN